MTNILKLETSYSCNPRNQWPRMFTMLARCVRMTMKRKDKASMPSSFVTDMCARLRREESVTEILGVENFLKMLKALFETGKQFVFFFGGGHVD